MTSLRLMTGILLISTTAVLVNGCATREQTGLLWKTLKPEEALNGSILIPDIVMMSSRPAHSSLPPDSPAAITPCGQ